MVGSSLGMYEYMSLLPAPFFPIFSVPFVTFQSLALHDSLVLFRILFTVLPHMLLLHNLTLTLTLIPLLCRPFPPRVAPLPRLLTSPPAYLAVTVSYCAIQKDRTGFQPCA